MELDKIELLLEKYFEGSTSLQEEKALKNYFASSEVAPDLEQYKAIFGYFSLAKKEKYTAKVTVTKKKKSYIAWMSVAASVMVLFGVGFYVYNHSFETINEDYGTFDSPELAFKETQKALNLISTHVNTGIESVQYINEFEQSKNKIFK
jgi:hypothetical protein